MLAGDLGAAARAWAIPRSPWPRQVGQGMRRMDSLTLADLHLAAVAGGVPAQPAKLLLVGARDGMWRGAMAAQGSLYLHSARPMVSESGGSPLLREVVQLFAQIHDRDGSDWLVESLTDYYAMELLRRSGGMSDDRYQAWQARLSKHGPPRSPGCKGGQRASPDSAQVARRGDAVAGTGQGNPHPHPGQAFAGRCGQVRG